MDLYYKKLYEEYYNFFYSLKISLILLLLVQITINITNINYKSFIVLFFCKKLVFIKININTKVKL